MEINISYRYFPDNQFIEQQTALENDYQFVCQCLDCLAKCQTLEICLKCCHCDHAPVIYLQNSTAKCLNCQQIDIHYWERLKKLLENGIQLKFITKYFSSFINCNKELIPTILNNIQQNCYANSYFLWKSIELAVEYSINNEDNSNVDYLFKLLNEQCKINDTSENIFQWLELK